MNNPRQLCLWGLSLICACLAACTTASLAPHRICSTSEARPWSLLGEIRWQHDKQFADTPVGGLSSIDYDAGSNLYYLVSDDRSAHGPARFYTARIEYDASGLHQVRLQNARPLLSPAQAPDPSPRQLEFLKHLCHPAGYTLKQIAEKMHVGLRTVEAHRDALFLKFGVRKCPALVSIAKDRRLV